MSKVTLEITDAQALVLRDALELLARVQMGQMGAVVDEVVCWRPDGAYSTKPIAEAREAADALRDALMPDNLGIQSTQIPERARIAWDMYQSVRYSLAWSSVPEGAPRPSWQVQYDEPMKTSAEPLPQVTVVTE